MPERLPGPAPMPRPTVDSDADLLDALSLGLTPREGGAVSLLADLRAHLDATLDAEARDGVALDPLLEWCLPGDGAAQGGRGGPAVPADPTGPVAPAVPALAGLPGLPGLPSA